MIDALAILDFGEDGGAAVSDFFFFFQFWGCSALFKGVEVGSLEFDEGYGVDVKRGRKGKGGSYLMRLASLSMTSRSAPTASARSIYVDHSLVSSNLHWDLYRLLPLYLAFDVTRLLAPYSRPTSLLP